MKTFGFDSTKLANNYTFEQLNELRKKIENDPQSQNPDYSKGSIYLYSPKARKKLDNIAWAVTYKLRRLKNDN